MLVKILMARQYVVVVQLNEGTGKVFLQKWHTAALQHCITL